MLSHVVAYKTPANMSISLTRAILMGGIKLTRIVATLLMPLMKFAVRSKDTRVNAREKVRGDAIEIDSCGGVLALSKGL